MGLLFSLLLLFSTTGSADIQPLKTLVECGNKLNITFGFGDITTQQLSETKLVQLIKQECTSITPGFELKWQFLEPNENQYQFSPSDQLVDFAKSNQLQFRGHTLIFAKPDKFPSWIERYRGKKEKLQQILRDHVLRVVARYKGKISVWDVINEAITDDGTLRKNIFSDALGEEYIDLAFRAAHEADPKALLFYNDYGLETNPTKAQSAYELMSRLKNRGAPISGIGFQFHLNAKFSIDVVAIQELFSKLGHLGLDIHITELDVKMGDLHLNESALKKVQKNIYDRAVSQCFSQSHCKQVTFWGVSDDKSFHNQSQGKRTGLESPHYPLLFDRHLNKKSAYDGIIEACQRTLTKRNSK